MSNYKPCVGYNSYQRCLLGQRAINYFETFLNPTPILCNPPPSSHPNICIIFTFLQINGSTDFDSICVKKKSYGSSTVKKAVNINIKNGSEVFIL